MKGGTSKVMAEGCAGVGQAWREQFVQKGAHMQNSWGIENCADCLDGGWRAVGREQTGAGSTCRNRGHIVNSVVNNPPANAGDVGSTPGLRRSKIPCRRKWQPTPVLLPGQRNLVGYCPQSRKRVRHTVQDLRASSEEFGVCSQSNRQTLKVRAALGDFPGCVLHKGAS